MNLLDFELLLTKERLKEITKPLISAGLITHAFLRGVNEVSSDLSSFSAIRNNTDQHPINGLTLVIHYQRNPADDTSVGFIFGRATPDSEIEAVIRRESRLKLLDVEKVARLEIEGAKIAEKLLNHLRWVTLYRTPTEAFIKAAGIIAGRPFTDSEQYVLARLFYYCCGVDEYVLGAHEAELVSLYQANVFRVVGPFSAEFNPILQDVRLPCASYDLPPYGWLLFKGRADGNEQL